MNQVNQNKFPLEIPYSISKSDAKNMLLNTIDNMVDDFDRKSAKKMNYLYFSIAAAALFFIVLFFNNLTSIESFESTKEYPVHYYLPDNSKIVASNNTTFKYNKNSYNKNRFIRFSGEGFFEVNSGATFELKGDLGTITVLGTSFSVLSTKYEFNVKCYSGRIKVKNKIGREFLLLPGYEIFITSDDGGTVTDFNNDKLPKWYNNLVEYNNESLDIIFQDLEIMFGIKFVLDMDKTRKYTGKISPQRIDNALKMVCLPMGLNYEIINDKTFRIY